MRFAAVLFLSTFALASTAAATSFDDRWGNDTEQMDQGRVLNRRAEIRRQLDQLLKEESRAKGAGSGEFKFKLARRIFELRARERLCEYMQDDARLQADCLLKALELSKSETAKEPLRDLCAKVPSKARKDDCLQESKDEAAYLAKAETGAGKIRTSSRDEAEDRGLSTIASAMLYKSVHPDPVELEAVPVRQVQQVPWAKPLAPVKASGKR